METLNFSFWQEIYSIAMGAISMFLVIVIHVYFRELKRLGLVPLWLWPSFIVGMPLVVSVLLIGSSVTGFSLDVLWSFVGSMPICWGINEKVLRQKMQPLVGPLRRKAYYSVLKDANLQRFFCKLKIKTGLKYFWLMVCWWNRENICGKIVRLFMRICKIFWTGIPGWLYLTGKSIF